MRLDIVICKVNIVNIYIHIYFSYIDRYNIHIYEHIYAKIGMFQGTI